ncbi:hypothetical protein PAAG_11964 [Paracoccidioides lutzii Pb01]|uniref:Uncharacterized protein n=1 Tax=Paracoccidioides lutzii (strain ATCC MYA-826 / Pb01) TaxID=502779 RepID=A0A0A2V1K1_PARBA|nr:hypothetical protein PAAG_11964 [Paracoccidioides lutzii Pb01]KGQ01383.1 hypothetical protein PAAG_11964 [Paracoccidioides lutzii Pb01]
MSYTTNKFVAVVVNAWIQFRASTMKGAVILDSFSQTSIDIFQPRAIQKYLRLAARLPVKLPNVALYSIDNPLVWRDTPSID